MGLVVLEDVLADKEKDLIKICRSDSGKKGYELREAHYKLGILASQKYKSSEVQCHSEYSILIMMRAGLNFGLGIADALEKIGCTVDIHFIEDDHISKEQYRALLDKKTIVVDAVINSGKSIVKVLNQLPEEQRSGCIIFTTVIPSTSIDKLSDLNIYSIRVSENQYKGAKVTQIQNGIGPDTGDRLFGTLF